MKVILLFLLGFAVTGSGRAEDQKAIEQDSPLFPKYLDVAEDLRCPTCTGLSVLESDARFSVQIKDIVKEQVAAGKDKEQILEYFVQRYGPWILRAPPKTGFNILAWVFPIVLMIAGPVLVWFFVWRKRRQVHTFGVRATASILDEMEKELSHLRGGAS